MAPHPSRPEDGISGGERPTSTVDEAVGALRCAEARDASTGATGIGHTPLARLQDYGSLKHYHSPHSRSGTFLWPDSHGPKDD
jgi:hypothetical protein